VLCKRSPAAGVHELICTLPVTKKRQQWAGSMVFAAWLCIMAQHQPWLQHQIS